MSKNREISSDPVRSLFVSMLCALAIGLVPTHRTATAPFRKLCALAIGLDPTYRTATAPFRKLCALKIGLVPTHPAATAPFRKLCALGLAEEAGASPGHWAGPNMPHRHCAVLKVMRTGHWAEEDQQAPIPL